MAVPAGTGGSGVRICACDFAGGAAVRKARLFGSALPRLGLVLAVAGLMTGAGSDAVQTTRKPVVVVRKTFDPAHMPNPRPPVDTNESGVCVSDSVWDMTYESRTRGRRKTDTGYEATVEILSGHLTVSLNITIWLPNNAAPWLKEHEEGHRQISEKVYASAEKAADSALQLCVGHTFTGTGPSPAEAEKDAKTQATRAAMDDYNAHVCAVWQRVNDIYDDLTNHGGNSMPGVARRVEVADAIRDAFTQYAQENPGPGPFGSATRPATQAATKSTK